ncbi:hypothetical protein C352_00869 [Cryptococcus neoformans CHC193]|nr:hypothetical protein C352_00869 [Cryptococcus neoformans var. grubii CHC193]
MGMRMRVRVRVGMRMLVMKREPPVRGKGRIRREVLVRRWV